MKFSVFYLLIPVLLIISCGRTSHTKQNSQGIITYKVTYLQNDLKNISPSLLPSKMVQKYRGHMSINTIEGFFGSFTMSNISDARKKINTTLLKVMGKGYMYSGPSGEYGCCFDPFVGMQVDFLPGNKTIAGYSCEKAIATFPGIKPDTFEVWYTRDIRIADPNINNPFATINGVLLEFNLHLKKLQLRLEAEKIENVEIPWSAFHIPKGYKNTSREKMENILNALME